MHCQIKNLDNQCNVFAIDKICLVLRMAIWVKLNVFLFFVEFSSLLLDDQLSGGNF